MKCGNRGCEYELYSDEADFLVCPGCGEPVLLDRQRSVPCDRRLHTPAERVMSRVKDRRFWVFAAYALLAVFSFAWFAGGPDALTRELGVFDTSITGDPSFFMFAFMMIGLGTQRVVPQMRLWVDDPDWNRNRKAQMLIRAIPYGIWAVATELFWSHPLAVNLQAALADQPAVAEAFANTVTVTLLGAYLTPIVAAGTGLVAEWLEVNNQHDIARVNALLMRKPKAFPTLHADEDPTDLDPDMPSQSNLASR